MSCHLPSLSRHHLQHLHHRARFLFRFFRQLVGIVMITSLDLDLVSKMSLIVPLTQKQSLRIYSLLLLTELKTALAVVESFAGVSVT